MMRSRTSYCCYLNATCQLFGNVKIDAQLEVSDDNYSLNSIVNHVGNMTFVHHFQQVQGFPQFSCSEELILVCNICLKYTYLT